MEITNTTEGSRVQVYQPVPGVPILQMVPEFRYTSQYLEYQYYREFQSSGILASTWSINTIKGSRVQVYQSVPGVPILQRIPEFRYTTQYLEYQYYKFRYTSQYLEYLEYEYFRGFQSLGILHSTWSTSTKQGSRFQVCIQYLEYWYYRGFQSSGIIPTTWRSWSISAIEDSRAQVLYPVPGVPGVPVLQRILKLSYNAQYLEYLEYQYCRGCQSLCNLTNTCGIWSTNITEYSGVQV